MARAAANISTSQKVLDIAEKLVQTRGFNGFSYADIAAVLRVTKASLHYHYPSKAELGTRLIERHDQTFRARLDEIERSNVSDSKKLIQFVQLYARVLDDNRMCLGGMLAAEQATLPRPMRTALVEYFEQNERWLTRLFERVHASGEIKLLGSPRDEAIAAFSLVKGAMLIARARGDATYFKLATGRLLACLGIETSPPVAN
jgi:TetR/AcrR family transcriptional repressor of nem operon